MGSGSDVAGRLATALSPFLGGDLPVRLRAWDGSVAGPGSAGVPEVELRSPQALRRLLRHPGELGAAQAYVTGELEVHGDLVEALTYVRRLAQARGLSQSVTGWNPKEWKPGAWVGALRTLNEIGGVGRPPEPPRSQAQVRGRLHSKLRDRKVISHHYDLSNEFYAVLMDETMAYSSGYWTSQDPGYGLVEAQRDKLDLVCRKLGVGPGVRLLDVGCGWGSLTLHAAQHYGATVRALTISTEQRTYVADQVTRRGLSDLVEVEVLDYRDAPARFGDRFDAVSSIEMGEHVGARNYPTYVDVLRRSVRPGGRVLIQQMSRPGKGGGKYPGGGPFIEAFIAPDMTMRPVGETVALIEAGGLEVRDVHALREHYVRTIEAWAARFEAGRERVFELVGEEVYRVWRLYLAGGMLTFRDGRMGVDQILAVRPGASHTLNPTRGENW